MSQKKRFDSAISLLNNYEKTKKVKVLQKATDILVGACKSPIYSTSEKITAFKYLLKYKDVENFEVVHIDVLAIWRDSLSFLKDDEAYILSNLLSEIVKLPELSPHDRLYTAVYLYNTFKLNVCYECFVFLATDVNNMPVVYRLDAIAFLFVSGATSFYKIAKNALLEIISSKDVSCGVKYKAIVAYLTNTGVKTLMNKSKLQFPYDENLVYDLQICYFMGESHDVRFRILSGQYLLQMSSAVITEETRKMVIHELFKISLSTDLTENVKADASDVILRLGDDLQKLQARKILIDIGLTADGSRRKIKPHTIYDNSQNIHDVSINEYIENFLIQLVEGKREYEVCNFEFVKEQIHKHLLSEDIYDFVRRNCVQSSLNRIEIDTAVFTSHALTLSEISCRVWSKIHNEKYEIDIIDCLVKRFIDELEEMSDTCSSGHAGRLVNVLSIVDDNMKISWKEQLKGNFCGRMEARIRECKDDDITAGLALGVMEDADEDDRNIYLTFIAENFEELKSELQKEFVDGGYISIENFEKYIQDIKQSWLNID